MKDQFDVCICPGCGEKLPKRNRGCGDCGFQSEGGRVLTVREFMDKPTFPEVGYHTINSVCPKFLRSVALIAVSQTRAAL